MKVLVAVGLVVGLFLLNAILLRANKKTPVPEGCENLTPDCNACGIRDCAIKGTYKKENKEDGNC